MKKPLSWRLSVQSKMLPTNQLQNALQTDQQHQPVLHLELPFVFVRLKHGISVTTLNQNLDALQAMPT
jgi:hypothetical protein